MSNPIKNILLADDDRDDVEMFQDAIREVRADISLIVAVDGNKLMHLLTAIPQPDAIFLDLNMPIKTGKECLREIRSNTTYDHIPVIILSTSSEKSEMEFCLNNGANHYLTKPSSYDGITNIVRRLCEGTLYPQTFITKPDTVFKTGKNK